MSTSVFVWQICTCKFNLFTSLQKRQFCWNLLNHIQMQTWPVFSARLHVYMQVQPTTYIQKLESRSFLRGEYLYKHYLHSPKLWRKKHTSLRNHKTNHFLDIVFLCFQLEQVHLMEQMKLQLMPGAFNLWEKKATPSSFESCLQININNNFENWLLLYSWFRTM
jgi:hypothetical protein